MIFNIIAIILFSSFWVQAFDKDFTTINDRAPYEFVAMFDSLKLEIKNPAEQIMMVGLCKDLDTNLGFLAKEHIYMLMKTEVIKNVLEHKFSKTRQLDITTQLIDRLEKDYKPKERYLNRFSQWIYKSVLAELNLRKNHGIITSQSFNVTSFSGEKLAEAQRFKRYLNYLSPWIDRMDNLNASEFNTLTKDVAWSILIRLNDRSLLFKKMAQTAQGDTKVTIFNIPGRLMDINPQDIKKLHQEEAELDLKEQSEAEKINAKKKIEQVSPDDLSPISDDVASELEKKASKP